jgi:hypothetical protein
MQTLSPEYLAEIGRQLAFLSAFLGGFAATFLGTLLTAAPGRRQACWAAGSAAVAAAAFVVTVISATALAIVLNPGAPAGMSSAAAITRARGIAGLSFIVGIYSMLLSLGLSGWIRSRALGMTTSISSFLAGVIATWAIAGF